MALVFIKSLRKDEKIIKIHKHKAIQKVPQNVIDQSLEDNNQIFKVSLGYVDSHLPLISFLNLNQMASITQVQLCKNNVL